MMTYIEGAMDIISIASLTTLCSTLSHRAVSSVDEVNGLVAAIGTGHQHTQQLGSVGAAVEQLNRHAVRLGEMLNATTVISERLRTVLSRSLAVCDAVTGTLHKQLIRLQPDNAHILDQSFLVAHEGFLTTYNQLFVYFSSVLYLGGRNEQNASLDTPAGQKIIAQAETASRLVANSRGILQQDNAINNGESSTQQPIHDNCPLPRAVDEPPPYSTRTTATQISSSTPNPRNDPGVSKGFFKALTSGLRRKPDPFVSALCQAVMTGDEWQVAGLISQGANVNGRNEAGNTPLKCAILSDHAVAARLLLSAGAEFTNSKDLPPLFQAASIGSMNVAKLLLSRGASVHDKNIWGQPYFADYVGKGNVPAVRVLLENGANANLKAITGQAVIADAVKAGNVGVVELLLKHGANVNATDIVGNPILAAAIDNGNTSLVELLLSQGANANVRTYLGMAVLEDAVAKKRLDIAKQLLVGGADVDTKDIYSRPILISVIRNPALGADEKVEVALLLLEHGADPNATDPSYKLPAICHALETPSIRLVEVILKHGARMKVRMFAGQTLLTYAIDFNRRDSVQVLLEHGVDVNEADRLQRTPLMLALLKLDYSLAKVLLDYGADAKAKRNKGAVDFVKALGRVDFLELMGLADNTAGTSVGESCCSSRAPVPADERPGRSQSPPPGYEVAVAKS